MRVYISVDMEGIAGVSHPHPTGSGQRALSGRGRADGRRDQRRHRGRPGGRRRRTSSSTTATGTCTTCCRPTSIRPPASCRARRPWSMVAGGQPGADGEPSFDVALFVGYHARAGHPRGTIAHTYSGAPVETRLDGRPTGEYGVNALVLGAWGIPVGMVAGDDALAEEVEGWLPWAERVVVKVADGGHSAASVHPTVARDRVRAGAERAVRRAAAGELELLRVGPPVVIEVDYAKGVVADFAALVPGAERVGDQGVRYRLGRPGHRVPRLPRGYPGGRDRRLSGVHTLAGIHQLPGARDRASRPLGGVRDPATAASPPARPRRPHRHPPAGPDRFDRRRRPRPGRPCDGLARRAADPRRPRRGPHRRDGDRAVRARGTLQRPRAGRGLGPQRRGRGDRDHDHRRVGRPRIRRSS